MTQSQNLPLSNFRYVAAPMVDQSDLPFRILLTRHHVTMIYTQMILADRFLNDLDYREFHLRDLQTWSSFTSDHHHPKIPSILQLGGQDVEKLLKTARCLETWSDGIDLNMGCPQTHALQNGYGASLLFPRNRTQVLQIVSSLSTQLSLPMSVKLRLNDPGDLIGLGQSLETSGASWITLHPRYISSRRRRKGAPFLNYVQQLKQAVGIPVISNGGVRCFDDLELNLIHTQADGLMVGEPLLVNPFLFDGRDDLVDVHQFGLEYTQLCDQFQGTVTLYSVKQHFHWILNLPNHQVEPRLRKLHHQIQASTSVSEVCGLFESRAEETI